MVVDFLEMQNLPSPIKLVALHHMQKGLDDKARWEPEIKTKSVAGVYGCLGLHALAIPDPQPGGDLVVEDFGFECKL